MKMLHRWMLVAAISTLAASGFAQTTGGGTGGATGGGGTASPQSTIQIIQTETPTITAPSESTTRSTVLSASNALAGFYNNPLYQGRAGALGSGLTTINAPGGFGTALYSTTGVSGAAGAGGTGGAAGTAGNRGLTAFSTTGTTGRTTTIGGLGTTAGGLGTTTGGLGRTTGGLGATTGGFGGAAGRGGTGGFGTNTAMNTQNAQLATGRNVAYTQTLRFVAPPPPTPTQLTTDLQSMISSSSGLSAAQGLQVTAGERGLVVLRGTVADADEARLVENMIRLTPGVRDVKNELTFK